MGNRARESGSNTANVRQFPGARFRLRGLGSGPSGIFLTTDGHGFAQVFSLHPGKSVSIRGWISMKVTNL